MYSVNENNSNSILNSVYFVDAYTGWTVSWGRVFKTTNGGSTFINPLSTETPSAFSLSQNYPNPFNPVTKIKFSVPQVRHLFGGSSPLAKQIREASLGGLPAAAGDLIQLKVYDVMGREVQTLVNESLKPGTYEATFDGSALNSGVYFYKMTARNYSETRKMLMIK